MSRLDGPLFKQRAFAGSLMLLPGVLVVYLGFNAGGYLPRTQDLVTVLLVLLLVGWLAWTSQRVLLRNRPLLRVTICFGAYAIWVLASALWSHAPLRATSEFDLTFVYLLALALYGCGVTSPRRMRWLVRGLALGSAIVCLAGLLSRTLPSMWPIASMLDTSRLSYPVTYWNTLGLLASLGAILCLGLTSDDAEPRFLKGISAFAIPIFTATLLLTFSRGAIAAGVIGVGVYVALARSRSLAGAAIAVVPTGALAFRAAYRATALARPITGNHPAVSEGRHVALIVAACCVAAACLRWSLVMLDRRLISLSWHVRISKLVYRVGGVAVLITAVAVSLAVGVLHGVSREYENFVHGNTLPEYAQARDRLTDFGADNRIDLWRVAVRQFDDAPIHGTGAGTFELAWDVLRPRYEQVVNAHSLYLETLGNLGLVGLGLLVCVLLLALAALVRRLRGADRALYAASFAAFFTWVVHAGVDWDWQMPVVSLPVFVLGGAAFASPQTPAASPSRLARGLLAAVVLLLAAIPALAASSESNLQSALNALGRDDCSTAVTDADTSLNRLSFRADAHEIVAFCEVATHRPAAALRDIKKAVHEDPNNWETHYGFSIVQAATGDDPRQEMAQALALDPKNELLLVGTEYFRYGVRRYWAQEAALDVLQIDGQGDRNLSELGFRPPAPAAGK